MKWRLWRRRRMRLLVNLGMQTPARLEAARAAIGHRGRPWVLDPVAAGAIPARTDAAMALLAAGPRVIKGNASEILALTGAGRGGRGTDATDDAATVLDPARGLARRTGAVVAITGAVDWVTDGERMAAVRLGHPTMAQVSGMGCVAGALTAACLAVEPDAWCATRHALTLLGLAGQEAGACAGGPGSFVPALLDALHHLHPGWKRCKASQLLPGGDRAGRQVGRVFYQLAVQRHAQAGHDRAPLPARP